jgi:predicted RNA binding protein YcfA (HicA-like mRNA interferase family)
VKLPRDLSGHDLAKLLLPYGYEVTRQTGSHMRLTSTYRGAEHHVTVPAHHVLRIGTLGAILSAVASYLEMDRSQLEQELFNS